MPSFADSIFLFVLALLLFGPKKLPVLARELGKWMGEFRRASNEFKMQMEDELRASEQADRQKQVAAMEAAAPIPPALGEPAEPEHPHLRNHASAETGEASEPEPPHRPLDMREDGHIPVPAETSYPLAAAPASTQVESAEAVDATQDATRPLPIATSGSLKMMPPATGLPTPRSNRPSALAGLVDSIPETPAESLPENPSPTGSVAHGD